MSSLIYIVAESYLLGSVPFGYLLVRLVRGEDVRHIGSGNIGATNVSRKSPALGVLTLLLDALKGAAAVAVARHLSASTGPHAFTAMSIAALFAVVGHVFPVWLAFRGGKGVATGLGAFAVVAPKAVLIAAGIFLALVLVFRYVSLGSILAVAAFPVLVWFLHSYGGMPSNLLLMALTSLLIVAKHHGNISRLLAGTENRFGAKPS
jgi:glycerol-3-phosphate acyltransferase PlsY